MNPSDKQDQHDIEQARAQASASFTDESNLRNVAVKAASEKRKREQLAALRGVLEKALVEANLFDDHELQPLAQWSQLSIVLTNEKLELTGGTEAQQLSFEVPAAKLLTEATVYELQADWEREFLAKRIQDVTIELLQVVDLEVTEFIKQAGSFNYDTFKELNRQLTNKVNDAVMAWKRRMALEGNFIKEADQIVVSANIDTNGSVRANSSDLVQLMREGKPPASLKYYPADCPVRIFHRQQAAAQLARSKATQSEAESTPGQAEH